VSRGEILFFSFFQVVFRLFSAGWTLELQFFILHVHVLYSPLRNTHFLGSLMNRNKQGFSHNTGYLTRKRSNNLGKTTGIQGTAIEKRIRVLVGH